MSKFIVKKETHEEHICKIEFHDYFDPEKRIEIAKELAETRSHELRQQHPFGYYHVTEFHSGVIYDVAWKWDERIVEEVEDESEEISEIQALYNHIQEQEVFGL